MKRRSKKQNAQQKRTIDAIGGGPPEKDEPDPLDEKVLDIIGAIEKLIQMDHQLIDNETNNKAELYMSFLCKFNAVKCLYLTRRGAFQARSMISGKNISHHK